MMMKKALLGAALLIFAAATTASAHYSGFVEDFLVGASDDSTADRLRAEIAKTQEEIVQLQPKLAESKHVYDGKKEGAIVKLRFYETIGPDVYMNYLLQSEDIVDFFANQRLVEKQLQGDLDQLNDLYLQYRQLKAATETLAGQEDLLAVIQKNLQERTRFTAVTKNYSVEKRAEVALDLWNAKAVIDIERGMAADAEYFRNHMQELLTRGTRDSPWRLDEAKINKVSKFKYLIRSDHVYVQYLYKDGTNTLLMGVVSKNVDGTASLKFDNGFLVGIPISADLVSQLPEGVKIDLSKVDPKTAGFTVEQTNGALLFHPLSAK
jgi:hypothetical protein